MPGNVGRYKMAAPFVALTLLAVSCSSSGNVDSDADTTVDDETSNPTEDSSTETDEAGETFETGTLTESQYFGEYELDDDESGASVQVTLSDTERTLTANGLPNHETGEFPNAGNPNTISEQDVSATFPLNPVFTGDQSSVREIGFSIAGVKFEPGTAERATCDNNVEYNVEALQDLIDLGLDFNNGHVQPTGAFHYHGVSETLADTIDSEDQDIVHMGFANDGFMVYYSRSGAYTPSYQLATDDREGTNCAYTSPDGSTDISFSGTTPDGTFVQDWEFDASLGDLDECNGIEVNGEYAYFMTDTYPFIGRCLNGESSGDAAGGGPSEGGGPPDEGGGPPDEGGGPPDEGTPPE